MKKQLLTTLENSGKYTLAVAEAMPEQGYDSQLVDGLWNFRELLSHIGYGIQWWESNHIKREETEWQPHAAKKSKKQVIEYLTLAYQSLEKTIDKSGDNNELISGFHATLDHITHHRGQAVVHLRNKGVVPPEYTY